MAGATSDLLPTPQCRNCDPAGQDRYERTERGRRPPQADREQTDDDRSGEG